MGNENLRIQDGFVVGAGSFACLIYCEFRGFVKPVVFQQGGMPRLRTLDSEFSVCGGIEVASSDGVRLDFGLGLLPSLQEITIWLRSKGAIKEEGQQLKAMLCHARKIHPNHPYLEINGLSDDEGAACSNSSCIASGRFLFLLRLVYIFSASVSDNE